MNVIEFFFCGPSYCCVPIKTVNNQTLSVFIFLLKVDDPDIESCCLTTDARHPRVCMKKKKKKKNN